MTCSIKSITVSLLFSLAFCLIQNSDAQTAFSTNINFNEAAFPTVNTTFLTGVPGASVSSGALDFNVLNDVTGSELGVLNGDLSDISITLSSTLPSIAGGVTPVSTFGWSTVSSASFRSRASFLGSVAANNPGSRIANTFTLEFGDHLRVNDFSFDVSSMNSRGFGWEVTIFEFLDANGNPFSTAPTIASYLAHLEINGDPNQINGSPSLGVFVLDSKTTVQNVGTNLTTLGNAGDNENFTQTGDLGYADVGLAAGTQIGGIRYTTYFEDVRGINNPNTNFTSSIIDFTFEGQIFSILVAQNDAAIRSTIDALPFIAAQQHLSLGASRSFTNDVNARLFRMRSGHLQPRQESKVGSAPIQDFYKVNDLGKNSIPQDGGKIVIDDARSSGKNPAYNSKSSISAKGVLIPSRVEPKWSVYTSGDFNSQEVASLSRLAGFDSQQYAGSLGIERRLLPNLAIGAAFSYIENSTNLYNRGEMDLKGYGFSGYISAQKGRLYGDLLYNYGDLNYSVRRNAGNGLTAYANPDSNTHQFAFNTGYRFDLGENIVHGPFASASYTYGTIDGYTETGGAADRNLRIGEQDFNSLLTEFGWQISYSKRIRNVVIIPQFRVAYVHENLRGNSGVNASLLETPYQQLINGQWQSVGSFDTSLPSQSLDRDYLTAGAGVQFAFRNGLSLFLNANQRFFRDYEEARHYSATLSLSF